jgi:hypothetical protein
MLSPTINKERHVNVFRRRPMAAPSIAGPRPGDTGNPAVVE